MAASDATTFPVKGVAFRCAFTIKSLSTGNPLTGGLTSLAGTVSKDGGSFTSLTTAPIEIGTTGIGVIDLSATEMNADHVIVNVSASNANAVNHVIEIRPADLTHVNTNVPPTSVDAMIRQIWERMYGKVINTGDYLRVMGPDGVTAFASMPITASPLTKEKSYS